MCTSTSTESSLYLHLHRALQGILSQPAASVCGALCSGKITDDPYAQSKDANGCRQKLPLTSVLTLDAKYFPEELFSSSEKR